MIPFYTGEPRLRDGKYLAQGHTVWSVVGLILDPKSRP